MNVHGWPLVLAVSWTTFEHPIFVTLVITWDKFLSKAFVSIILVQNITKVHDLEMTTLRSNFSHSRDNLRVIKDFSSTDWFTVLAYLLFICSSRILQLFPKSWKGERRGIQVFLFSLLKTRKVEVRPCFKIKFQVREDSGLVWFYHC